MSNLEVTNNDKIEETKPKPSGENESENDDTVEHYRPAEASLIQKIIRKGLVESKEDIEIQRKDPSSPLYSVKTFEALHLYVVSFFL